MLNSQADSETQKSAYLRYVDISSRHNILPFYPCDLFDINNSAQVSPIDSSPSSHLNLFYSQHRWTKLVSVKVAGAGLGYIIFAFGANISNITISASDEDFLIIFGPHSRIENTVIQVNGSNNTLVFGAHTSASGLNILSQGDKNYIIIGHDSMLSTGIHIRNSDSHSIYSYSEGIRLNKDLPVVIGDHCWIGRNVTIGKGSSLPDDCILGQESVLTRELSKPSSVYAGIPAHLRRENVTWDRSQASTIEHIKETLIHRRAQLSCNQFLLNDTPFLPMPFPHTLDRFRKELQTNKQYPWLNMLFPEDKSSQNE